MTTPHKELLIQARDALEEAYNGLEWFKDSYPVDVNGSDDEAGERITAAIASLQAAIDQPDPEPVAFAKLKEMESAKNFGGSFNAWPRRFKDTDVEIYTHPAPAIKEVTASADHREMLRQITKRNQEVCAEFSRLQVAPAKPLTDAQILSMDIRGTADEALRFARAIEAAHGIGVKP